MAASAGKDAYFKFAGTDISAYVDTAGLDRTCDMLETTTLNSDDKSFIPGLKSATIPIAGPYDPTVDLLISAKIGAAAFTFEYGPASSTAAAATPVYTGNILVSSYSCASPVAGRNAITGTLQTTGAITRGTGA